MILLYLILNSSCRLVKGASSDGTTLDDIYKLTLIPKVEDDEEDEDTTTHVVNADCYSTSYDNSILVTATAAGGFKYYQISYKPTTTVALTKATIKVKVSSCSLYLDGTQLILYSDSGGNPNVALSTSPTSYLCSQLPSTIDSLAFSFSSYSMTANTQYHFVLKVGGLTNGDTITLNQYATNASNCTGTSNSGIGLLSGTWSNQTSPQLGILYINR